MTKIIKGPKYNENVVGSHLSNQKETSSSQPRHRQVSGWSARRFVLSGFVQISAAVFSGSFKIEITKLRVFMFLDSSHRRARRRNTKEHFYQTSLKMYLRGPWTNRQDTRLVCQLTSRGNKTRVDFNYVNDHSHDQGEQRRSAPRWSRWFSQHLSMINRHSIYDNHLKPNNVLN